MPSPMDHSALTLDAVSRIPAGYVRLYSASTWSHGAAVGHCPLTSLQITLEIRCWTIQYRTIIEKEFCNR